MKLKTTVLLAACGIVTSAAAAFAVPLEGASSRIARAADRAAAQPSSTSREGGAADPARLVAGDTLMIDARLGHASLGKGEGGETFLFAQVTGAGATDAVAAPPMNLAIVIDRSGSMKGERIANAMNAAVFAVERLREGDTVTVVSFDTAAQVVVPPTRIASGNRSRIESAIRSIRLGGDTCISCGLSEAMNQLGSTTLGGDGVGRMILLSDGATNAGIKDVPGLRAMASRMRGRGVTISTIGVDVDFDEKVMAAIANEANGRHYFVENASGLQQVFSQEFDDLLASVANDSELVIDLAPGVEMAEVFDRTFRREGRKLIVPFGTFSAKQEKTVLVKLRVPTDHDGDRPVADVKLAYRDLRKKSDGTCGGSLALAVKNDGSEQRSLDPFVAARLERSRTASTLTDVNRLFESGHFAEARAKLATRRAELQKSESSALAAAPSAAAPRAGRALDRDFADQLGAVAKAERTFAPPPPAKGSVDVGSGGPLAPTADPAPATPASREGKASIRLNQQAASEFGF
jgi:Ca-activated chloride channel family protein